MGLGAKVKNTLFDLTRDILDFFGDTIGAIIVNALRLFGDMVEKPLIGMISWQWKALTGDDDPPPQLKELLEKGERSKELAFVPVLLGIASALGMALIMAIASTFMNKVQQEVNLHVSTALLPPDLVTAGTFRGILAPGDVEHHMARAGFDPTTTQFYQDILRPRSAPFDYVRMWLRGEFSEDEVDGKLGELGYADNEIEVFKTLAYYIPPVPDLTRMAVREAFTPEIVSQYELDADFPPEFEEFAAMQGVSPEWAKNYWRAHWELPSIQMGFEMMHRGVITQDELDVLLRTLDVMKFWRPKITAISYRPFSRVDVRRMYRVGVLDEAGVERSYLDLGYNAEKARAMTDFTILFEKQSDRDLSKAELLRGYRERLLDRPFVKSALQDYGYDEDESEFYLSLEDVKLADETTKFRIDLALIRYRAGEIDDNGLLAALGELNLPAEQQELLVEKEQLRKQVKDKQPTREDVTRWYQAEIIEESDARTWLSDMKYSERIVDLYLSEIPRAPSVSTTLRWLVNGYIDESAARSYLTDLRYASKEVDLFISEATAKLEEIPREPTVSVVKKWYQQELINEIEARTYLVAMGYADKEIDLFIKEWTPKP